MIPAGCPALDYASLAGWLDVETSRRISPAVIIRRTGQKTPGGGQVISIELHGICLALVKPDRVTFPGPEPPAASPAGREWLARVVADNGLGTSVSRVQVTTAPGTRKRLLAIDGDRHLLLAGNSYPVPAARRDAA